MRILIWGITPFATTAYGLQGYKLAKLFQKLHHEVLYLSYSGISKACQINYDGIEIISGNDNGLTLLPFLLQDFKPSLALQFFDLWTLPIEFPGEEQLTSYTPIDSSPMAWRLQMMLPRMKAVISMSKFHQEECHKLGINSNYIPHIVDDQVFSPQPQSKARAFYGYQEKAFIVGINAVNLGLRKNFEGMLQGFSLARKQCPNMKLALFTWARRDPQHPEAVDLIALIQYLEIPFEALYFIDQRNYLLGVPKAELALWYNTLDVNLLASSGEGFGIPIVEAGLCQVPSIVTDNSAMTEVAGNGIKLTPQEIIWFPLNQTFMWRPSSKALADSLINLCQDEKLLPLLGKEVRDHCLKNYTPKVVEPLWQNYLLNR